MPTSEIRELARRLQRAGLSDDDAPDEPAGLIGQWLEHATSAGIYLANSLVVSTVDSNGRPSSRTVLLKEVSRAGLVFYTSYEGRKAREMAGNPHVACLLVWPQLSRQVRVTGESAKVPAEESDRYFATRERGAQLEAWASPQSAAIPGREWLEKRFSEYERKYAGGPVPRPPHWGGFRVSLRTVEFWQGRDNRMHDRLFYEMDGDGRWVRTRLAP